MLPLLHLSSASQLACVGMIDANEIQYSAVWHSPSGSVFCVHIVRLRNVCTRQEECFEPHSSGVRQEEREDVFKRYAALLTGVQRSV